MNVEAFAERYLNVSSVSGDEMLVFCVFHEDGGKPSMYLNKKKGLFYCHACGAKGGMSKLQELFGTGLITRDMSLDLIRERLRALQVQDNEEMTVYPDSWLDQFTSIPTDYWEDVRGLSPKTIDMFDLGYDPFTDAAIIPLRDSHGRVLGVIRRHMGNYQPRYLYPKGFRLSKHLFGANIVRAMKMRTVALCEGSVDCMALWDANVPAMALLGSRLSQHQSRLLREVGVRNVILFMDNDAAGQAAIPDIIEGLSGLNIKIVDYGSAKAKDPADLSRSERRTMYRGAVPWWRLALSVR